MKYKRGDGVATPIDNVQDLPIEVWRSLEDASRSVKRLLRDGIRNDYGIGPNTPLTAGQKRQLLAIDRGIDKLRVIDEAIPKW